MIVCSLGFHGTSCVCDWRI